MGSRYPYHLLSDSPTGQSEEAEIARTLPTTAPTFGDIRQGEAGLEAEVMPDDG